MLIDITFASINIIEKYYNLLNIVERIKSTNYDFNRPETVLRNDINAEILTQFYHIYHKDIVIVS